MTVLRFAGAIPRNRDPIAIILSKLYADTVRQFPADTVQADSDHILTLTI